MKDYTLNKDDFAEIAEFIKSRDIKLLVADLNGVIDDYYNLKFAYLKRLLGDDDEYFGRLVVYIEREYMSNREATLEQSVVKFYAENNLAFSDLQATILNEKLPRSMMTDVARSFFENLQTEYAVYTSLSEANAREALRGLECTIYSGDVTAETKPSVVNLQAIFNAHDVTADQVCVIGDGLVDDLMPAKLIGAHTILVSPFADKIVIV
jgi:predicted HAD superfamily phosphohydrolase YqeG